MTTQTAMVLVALIGAAGTILGIYVNAQKQRKQLVLSKEFDGFFALEQLAGQLVEELAGHGPLNESTLRPKLEEYRQAGRFARYDDVRRAVLQLQNTLERMFFAKR